MKTTYSIYKNNQFIGSCFLNTHIQFIQGGLSLVNQSMMYHEATKHNLYVIGTKEIDIIVDLMQKFVPSFRINGLNFTAIDSTGKSQII